MRPAGDPTVKHLGLDGECLADMAATPSLRGPLTPGRGADFHCLSRKSKGPRKNRGPLSTDQELAFARTDQWPLVGS